MAAIRTTATAAALVLLLGACTAAEPEKATTAGPTATAAAAPTSTAAGAPDTTAAAATPNSTTPRTPSAADITLPAELRPTPLLDTDGLATGARDDLVLLTTNAEPATLSNGLEGLSAKHLIVLAL